MISQDFLKGRRRRELSVEEAAALESVFTDVRQVPARTTLVHRGDRVRQSILLLSGMMCRYLDARDGQRQLLAVHVPGDFTDLHGFPLQRLDHDVATLSDCRIAIAPHDRLLAVTEAWPHLTRLLWFSTLLDSAMHREWIFRLGRLSAHGRIAHFLCETYARLEAVGRAENGDFDLPMTQQDLAEACGLTSVHVNRMIARLRDDGAVLIANRQVKIQDFGLLARLGEFNPDYLFLDAGPE